MNVRNCLPVPPPGRLKRLVDSRCQSAASDAACADLYHLPKEASGRHSNTNRHKYTSIVLPLAVHIGRWRGLAVQISMVYSFHIESLYVSLHHLFLSQVARCLLQIKIHLDSGAPFRPTSQQS